MTDLKLLNVCLHVSTGKTLASPYEYGSFGEFRAAINVLSSLFEFIWLNSLIIFVSSSWQRQHSEFRGRHWQRHINGQQLRIHGYEQTSTLFCDLPLSLYSPHFLKPEVGFCISSPSLLFCVFFCIRTGAFQTSTNPQSPSPHSHPLRWHTATYMAQSVPRFAPNQSAPF